MTIREALRDLMEGRGELDPAAVLESYGLGDLPPDALETALGHFAERAPLDMADALSPIVTRLSEVPFGEGDLPSAPDVEAMLADSDGVFELLADVAGGVTDADPGDLDFDGLADVADADDLAESLADTFGTGEFAVSTDEAETTADDADADYDFDTPAAESTGIDGIDDLDDVAEIGGGLLDDLSEVVDGGDDFDPDDLDFDLG
ncbi:MAG: hypothetical protein AAF962_16220 [Actinomycetota bacterium]